MPRRSNRRAITLVELCVVMVAVTLVAVVTTTLLHAMMRQQAAAGKQLLAGNSLMRLSDRFRKDVQKALEARIDSAARITLVQPEGTLVSYHYQDTGAIRRTVQIDDDTRQDEYDLQTAHQIAFVLRNLSDTKKMVVLTARPGTDPVANDSISSRDPQYVVSTYATTIIAELGRDHRWRDIRESVDEERPK